MQWMMVRDQSAFLGQEDHADVGVGGHVLDSFEVADLHGCLAAEDVGGLPHQPGRLHLRSRVEDLRLRQPLLLGHCRQNVLEFLVEDDVLDEDVGDLDAPLVHLPRHELPQLQGDLVALLQQFLEDVMSANGAEGGKGELLHRPLDVFDRVVGLAGDAAVVVDGCVDSHLDVVSGDGVQPVEIDDIGLHVDNVDRVREGIEVLQPRPHRLYVPPKPLINPCVTTAIPTKLWSICL
jgi:hypothetical protein